MDRSDPEPDFIDHFEDAELGLIGAADNSSIILISQALMAVAQELRTANLIEVLHGFPLGDAPGIHLKKRIEKRLGL